VRRKFSGAIRARLIPLPSAVELARAPSARRRDRYAMPGAARARAVFRRWNSPKNPLRRSNLQSLDARDFFQLTPIWHKRCSR
jgi:hypothetical protein